MYGKDQWIGREVEGRYSDMMTFFVRELGDGINVDNLSQYPHYYFTVEYMLKSTFDIEDKYLPAIREILDTTNSVVTLEASDKTFDALPPDLFNRCHIIYRIKTDAVQILKETDTLSIDNGWYRVHQITKCNMMEIKPDNYKYDYE
tara:strand:+ start:61 stop:498 length:438 start_codon:yes stop_codon:yes gene_type:complete